MDLDFRTICWIIGTGIGAGTPLLYSAIGETLSERCGVLNCGLEGLMLIGAVCGYIISQATGNLIIALLGVLAICAFCGLIIAFLQITLRSNQVATGIAFTFFGTGFSGLIGKPFVGTVARASFADLPLPFLDNVEWLQLILSQDIMAYAAVVIAIAAYLFVYKTKAGLHLRAAGDNPATLDSLGVNVIKVRYIYTIVGCALAGIGGAYLSLAYSPGWIENMAASRGWLTIALVNFALWKPQNALLGAYLFGIFTSFSYRLEAMGVAVPSYFLRMIPYVLPLVVLVVIGLANKGKTSPAPKYLAVAYIRDAK